MRCPKCGFVSSDARDLCGKCFVDLRPRKTQLGIHIAHPGMPYDQVLVLQKSGAAATETPPVNQTFVPPEKKGPVIPTITKEAPPITKPAVPFQKRMEPRTHTLRTKAKSEVTSEPTYISSGAESARYDQFDVAQLFDQAALDIRHFAQSSGVELTTSQLKNLAGDREQIDALWAFTAEVIRNPDALLRVRDITSSATRQVKAEGVEGLVEKIEASIAAPQFSLRGGGVKVTQRDEGQEVDAALRIPTKPITPATRRDRIYAGAFDFVYIAFLSLGVLYGLLWFSAPHLRPNLFSPSQLPEPEQIALLALWLMLDVVFGILYPYFSGARTLGQKVMALETLELTGREATQLELFLRSILLPVSMACTLIVPPLWRTLGFHNRLSKTVVSRVTPQNE